MEGIRNNNPHTLIDVAKLLHVKDFRDTGKLIEQIKELSANSVSDTVLYGTTIETIFCKSVCSINRCQLIKEEDKGNVFAKQKIIVPDYSIITNLGDAVFVEVKECNKDKLEFKKTYIKKLERYSRMFNRKLFFAIYWNIYNLWSLSTVDDFVENEEGYTANMIDVIPNSNMHILGDLVIGFMPPMIFRLKAKIANRRKVSVDTTELGGTISDVEVYYDGKKVERSDIKSTLIFFMFYGSWQNTKVEKHCDDNYFWVDYIFEPGDPNGSNIIGSFASILTRYYKFKCYGLNKDKIDIDPEVANLNLDFIFNYNKEKIIRLWIFEMVPKKDKIV